MIYLIDDNKYGQLATNYKVDFTTILELYSGVITWLENISKIEIDLILKNASCILIHDSLESNEEKNYLIAQAKKSNIPYCLFSNGFTATIFKGESIEKIKKDRLYNNLLIFIKEFKNNSKVDMGLLSLGQNYEGEKAAIIQDRLINGTLLAYKDNFDYEAAFPSGSQEYKDLMELVYLSDPSIDFSYFEDKYNSQVTTAQLMRSLIINMVKNVKQKNG